MGPLQATKNIKLNFKAGVHLSIFSLTIVCYATKLFILPSLQLQHTLLCIIHTGTHKSLDEASVRNYTYQPS